ncbi:MULTISPECIES: hypothetical protein [Caldilinea]|jgi:hypothetical protein|uniref:Uncharacterized protein n=1 Tax=Caldilinea aerophila (strain DSM 14535 / JCM 11387 / NBRC 104270 / STL-6-O1) TaxID=926550 RepID=I0I995_CALAS|nr:MULTISPECIES: hypothetical protein [Caldilinea]MBO9394702.1 hypothetical protein [Caldilinea sp.]BAM01833.1 hypothetical protein CLDAP_37930 [Caldilinea aerophila DSM 14535 = NBRC 104270]GIV73168.1 MAG: hypothetical protein KatS3mg049_1724 [Caldilinea sp.]
MDDRRWTESDVPLISPDARFRKELSRSLQETYQRRRLRRQRYHQIQSRLQRLSSSLPTLLSAVSLLSLVFGLGYFLGRKAALRS